MVFMDYRDYVKNKQKCPEAEYPTFLYAMPMSSTRVFFEVSLLCSLNVFVKIYSHIIIRRFNGDLIIGNMFSIKKCHAL